MSNYSGNIQRMSQADDFDPHRFTGVDCDYVHHRGDATAIINVKVDNDCCNHKAENQFVNLCWRDAITGYHDGFECRCGSEESSHSANDLTFLGELAEVERPVPA